MVIIRAYRRCRFLNGTQTCRAVHGIPGWNSDLQSSPITGWYADLQSSPIPGWNTDLLGWRSNLALPGSNVAGLPDHLDTQPLDHVFHVFHVFQVLLLWMRRRTQEL